MAERVVDTPCSFLLHTLTLVSKIHVLTLHFSMPTHQANTLTSDSCILTHQFHLLPPGWNHVAVFTVDPEHDNTDLFLSIHCDAFIVKSVPKEQEEERGNSPSRLCSCCNCSDCCFVMLCAQ